jgi:glucoamylase
MPKYRNGKKAFGSPGLPPRWTHGDKDGVGTAYSGSSRLWFTVWNGIVTELYHPTVDRPQVRDLQFLISDGETFLHQETKDLRTQIKRIDKVLAYNVQAQDPGGLYSFDKLILADPHQPCLLIHTRLHATPEVAKRLKLYVLCSPHLECGGAHNSGYVIESTGRERILMAQKDGMWMVIAATHPFSRASVGYVGTSDGYTDLADGYQMKWEFDKAEDGNIALMGEIPLEESQEFTLGVAFGDTLQRALTTLFQSLSTPFEQHRKRYAEQWLRSTNSLLDLSEYAGDEGHLYSASCQLLLAHEDKLYQGAMIASLAIPWGHVRGDKEGAGGYHLVWPRDITQSALALLAIGNKETPLRSLIYLATAQQDDGGFAQNFWIDGTPFWKGVQLDEAAFPILLAYRLWKEDALSGFDPLSMVVGAASYLIRQGPVTGQERWEENSGYSPSTLAACIAALIAAASYIRFRKDLSTAQFIEDYADYLESRLEEWTVTEKGDLVEGITSHYVRMQPIKRGKAARPDDLEKAKLKLTSHAPGAKAEFPARSIVDAGFLELVRYGVRAADDPMIERSVRVVDEVLKAVTPSGTCWRRYNHDGYGQRGDGEAYDKYGVGRAWPLLAGERGHYEIAAGRLPVEQIRSMEGFSTPTHLLPEQVWDEPDRPEEQHLRCGRPTGSAAPQLWAHAEYIKLLRSARDERVYERVDEVVERYLNQKVSSSTRMIWSHNHPAKVRRAGETIRLIAEEAFEAHWTHDKDTTIHTLRSSETPLGVHYVDLDAIPTARSIVKFAFHWTTSDRNDKKHFAIEVASQS